MFDYENLYWNGAPAGSSQTNFMMGRKAIKAYNMVIYIKTLQIDRKLRQKQRYDAFPLFQLML